MVNFFSDLYDTVEFTITASTREAEWLTCCLVGKHFKFWFESRLGWKRMEFVCSMISSCGMDKIFQPSEYYSKPYWTAFPNNGCKGCL